jgi:hypothetical protein
VAHTLTLQALSMKAPGFVAAMAAAEALSEEVSVGCGPASVVAAAPPPAAPAAGEAQQAGCS